MDTTGMKTAKPENLPAHSHWLESTDAAQLAQTLATTIAEQLRAALDIRPRASLAVSGGRTPLAMLQHLSQEKLDWQRVDITLADERWVNEADSASNAALVKANLITQQAAEATFYPLYNGQASATEGQASCQKQLRAMHWPLDALVLGMGNDGHTASLFPQCPALHQALSATPSQLCLATQAPVQPTQRMTLTAATLMRARNKHLHIEGAQKRQVLEQAMHLRSAMKMPIFTFLQHPLTIHWCP
jgi:6-phosphogluconolactonase